MTNRQIFPGMFGSKFFLWPAGWDSPVKSAIHFCPGWTTRRLLSGRWLRIFLTGLTRSPFLKKPIPFRIFWLAGWSRHLLPWWFRMCLFGESECFTWTASAGLRNLWPAASAPASATLVPRLNRKKSGNLTTRTATERSFSYIRRSPAVRTSARSTLFSGHGSSFSRWLQAGPKSGWGPYFPTGPCIRFESRN